MPNQQVIPDEIVNALVECFTKDDLIATAAAGVFTFRYGDAVVDVFPASSLIRAAHEANPLVKERYGAELNGAFNMFRFFRDNPELLSETLRARIVNVPKLKKDEVNTSVLSALQRIYYGAPGTGKSYQTDEIVKKYSDTIRVTFHPDSDYASFVGCYKPAMSSQDVSTTAAGLSIDELAARLKEEWNSADPDKGKVGTACLFVDKYKDYFDGPLGTMKVSDLVRRAGLPEETYSRWLSTALVVAKHRPSSQINESRIVYEFVPQAFAKAYELAWRKMTECKEGEHPAPQFLVIEEINRGNCAQIFGDLFQLLDRDDAGYSKYPVDPDTDLAKHLHGWFRGEFKDGEGKQSPTIIANDSDEENWKANKAGADDSHTDATWADVLAGRNLVLPPNLYIWATMNTSDQSLFPMDSAFKRRWDWKYVPIRMPDKKEDGTNWEDGTIRIPASADGTKPAAEYAWWDFLETINERIGDLTSSEDKKLGYFFVKADSTGEVPLEAFVNKVVFYLWNDAFRAVGTEELGFEVEVSKKKKDGSEEKKKRPAQFEDFFKPNGDPDAERIREFLTKLEVPSK